MNTTTARRGVPSWGVVFPEQLRTVGLAIRREILIVVPLALGASLLGVVLALLQPGVLDEGGIPPAGDLSSMAATIGFFFPLLVWKSEKRHGPSHLWTLPINHRRHALSKVVAGWPWLVLLLGVALAWLMIVFRVVGVEPGVEGTRLVLGQASAGGNSGAPPGTYEVAWTTPAWQWLVPFSAATCTYLLGSALVLATDHVWGWGIAVYLVLGTIGVVLEAAVAPEALGRLVNAMILPPFGADTLISSGEETLSYWHQPPGGEQGVRVWRALPQFRTWATGTLLWTAVAIAALGAATMRHKER